MRKLSLADLGGLTEGRLVERGGFRIYPEPGFRTHDEPSPHVHTKPEFFCILQGSGDIEIDGARVDRFTAGDLVVIDPGEDHHLISDGTVPLVFTWLHLEDDLRNEQ